MCVLQDDGSPLFLVHIRRIDALSGSTSAAVPQPEGESGGLIAYADKAICTGAATIYECSVLICKPLAIVQKRLALASAAAEFVALTKGHLGEKTIADYVHKALKQEADMAASAGKATKKSK